MRHSPKGGITAINGEFYKGGQFLPNTKNPKLHTPNVKATGKIEIAPYIWEVPPKGIGGFYVSL